MVPFSTSRKRAISIWNWAHEIVFQFSYFCRFMKYRIVTTIWILSSVYLLEREHSLHKQFHLMQLLSQFVFCTFSRWPNSSTENLSILLYSHFRDARCYKNSTELSSPLGTLFTNASWCRKKWQNSYSGHWDMKNGVWLPGQRVLGPVKDLPVILHSFIGCG